VLREDIVRRAGVAARMVPVLVAIAGVGCRSASSPPEGGDEELPEKLLPYASLGLWASDSVERQPIPDGAAWHADDEILRQSLVDAEPFVALVDQFTTPVFFASERSPVEAVPLHCGDAWGLDIGAFEGGRIPAFAAQSLDEDGQIPIQGCGEDSDRDDFMVVFDLDAGCEYDFWQVRGQAGAREASWAVGFPIDGEPILPHGLSARASGFAFAGGLIWPDEIEGDRIDHALLASYPSTRAGGPVAPATDSDGITEDDAAIPLGARVQLDPALDLQELGIEGAALVIARALQEFGMFIVDTGGEAGIGLYGIARKSARQDPWAGIFPAEPFVVLDQIPADALHVLDFGPQDAAFRDNIQPADNRCTRYGRRQR
jgi:hypothetical protein